MPKSQKSFEDRLAAMAAGEHRTAGPKPAKQAPEQQPGHAGPSVKPVLIACGLALAIGIPLGLFSDRIIGKVTEANRAIATVITARALDQVNSERAGTLTALDVATNPPTAMMASFGQLHAEQVAKYGDPDKQSQSGLDHKGAHAQDIANRMDRYLIPDMQ